MVERKYASFFEIIDLVERVFPPKSEMNYIKISSQELVSRFNEEVEKSGFYFKEETLVRARRVISQYQDYNYNRNSVYIGARPDQDYGFDQMNYSIQNN